MIITNEKIAEETVRSLLENNYAGYRIAGVVVQDRDMRGQTIAGIPVVANTKRCCPDSARNGLMK